MNFNLIKKEMSCLLHSFTTFFSNKGYIQIPAVKISSRVDKTVTFVGSHISTLKPYIVNNNIPEDGLFIIQPCLRTQTLKYIKNPDIEFSFGTFFRSLGVLIPGDKVEKLAMDAVELITSTFNVNRCNLVVRVNSNDHDLTSLAQSISDTAGVHVELDAMHLNYYRHTLGVDGLAGRNFNFAINRKGVLQDIGNLILLENKLGIVGVELALGSSVILKEKLNLPHCSFSEALMLSSEKELSYKFHDAIIATIHLLSEGLRPSSKNNQCRALRFYIKSILFYMAKYDIDMRHVIYVMKEYELRYHLNGMASQSISNYLEMYGIGDI